MKYDCTRVSSGMGIAGKVKVLAFNGRTAMSQVRHVNNGTNELRVATLKQVVEALMAEMLQRGVFGTGTVKFNVQDGTIQEIQECRERKHH